MRPCQALRHDKKQHYFKVKLWNWSPITIWHNTTCVHFFFFKNHSTLMVMDPKICESRLFSISLLLFILGVYLRSFWSLPVGTLPRSWEPAGRHPAASAHRWCPRYPPPDPGVMCTYLFIRRINVANIKGSRAPHI